jgi:hypothetical protein
MQEILLNPSSRIDFASDSGRYKISPSDWEVQSLSTECYRGSRMVISDRGIG